MTVRFFSSLLINLLRTVHFSDLLIIAMMKSDLMGKLCSKSLPPATSAHKTVCFLFIIVLLFNSNKDMYSSGGDSSVKSERSGRRGGGIGRNFSVCMKINQTNSYCFLLNYYFCHLRSYLLSLRSYIYKGIPDFASFFPVPCYCKSA